METNQQLNRQKIRAELPHGASKQIAELAKVSPACVSTWFKGANNSLKIESAAVTVYEKVMHDKNKKLKRYKQLNLI